MTVFFLWTCFLLLTFFTKFQDHSGIYREECLDRTRSYLDIVWMDEDFSSTHPLRIGCMVPRSMHPSWKFLLMGASCTTRGFVTRESDSAKWIVEKNSHCWHDDTGGKSWQLLLTLAMKRHPHLRIGGQGRGLGVLVPRGYFELLDYH